LNSPDGEKLLDPVNTLAVGRLKSVTTYLWWSMVARPGIDVAFTYL
jgi:hypothetical protein